MDEEKDGTMETICKGSRYNQLQTETISYPPQCHLNQRVIIKTQSQAKIASINLYYHLHSKLSIF